MMRWLEDRGWSERGQALVEFAVAATAFIFLALGLLDIGLGVANYNTLAQATREGTRYAIVHGAESTDPSGPGSQHFTPPNSDVKVTEVVAKHAEGLDPSRLTVEAEWPDGSNAYGSKVKVTSRYQYQPVVDFFGILSVELKSSSVMDITY